MNCLGIKVESLKKNFAKNVALDKISLDFRPNTTHGIIGPEGAGKTTLLRLLAGLLTPQEGSITYHYGDKKATFDDIRSSLGYMPQEQSLYPDLSISEHLDFFRDLYQIPTKSYRLKRQQLLEITQLQPFEERQVGNLSGGMYKKVGLMCALLSSPKLLLLDEPTNGIDPLSRRDFWKMLHNLDDLLVIVTTSYMDEAERCNTAHLIQDGHLIASGEPKTLLREEDVDNFDAFFLKKTGGL
ncbi:MAG: ABC transporter ATP-binding protein [Chlamydiota bacterium]